LNVLLVWASGSEIFTDWRGRGEFDRRLKHQLLVVGWKDSAACGN